MNERCDEIRDALRGVIDPELGIDVVNLGLIYGIGEDAGDVDVVMTLTTPGCPMHATIRGDVEQRLRQLPWLKDLRVHVTYNPPWTPERLTPVARAMLGR